MGLFSETRFGSAYSLALGIRFGFGYAVRLRAACLNVRKSIAKAGMRDGFGILQLSEKLGEKQKHCEVSAKRLGAQREERVCFPFVSRVCSEWGGGLAWGSAVA